MKQPYALLIFFVFITNYSFAQIHFNNLPVEKTIVQNQEVEIFLKQNINRIIVTLQNESDGESVISWTQFNGNQELPENEIGPKKYRTYSLAPQIMDENHPIRLDRKELVLNKGNADNITIRIEKGEVNIQIKPYKKSL